MQGKTYLVSVKVTATKIKGPIWISNKSLPFSWLHLVFTQGLWSRQCRHAFLWWRNGLGLSESSGAWAVVRPYLGLTMQHWACSSMIANTRFLSPYAEPLWNWTARVPSPGLLDICSQHSPHACHSEWEQEKGPSICQVLCVACMLDNSFDHENLQLSRHWIPS